MKQKDGKYLIMKDPNKPMIRLYDIPDNTFESDGESESDEDTPQDSTAFQSLYPYNSSAKRWLLYFMCIRRNVMGGLKCINDFSVFYFLHLV